MVFYILAGCIVLILAVVSLFIIQDLRQIKRTTKTLEEFIITLQGEIKPLLQGIRETNERVSGILQDTQNKLNRVETLVNALKETGEAISTVNRLFKGGIGQTLIHAASFATGLKGASQYVFKHWSKGGKKDG